jgi:NADH:ubiquinone oxidoreductase subunit E
MITSFPPKTDFTAATGSTERLIQVHGDGGLLIMETLEHSMTPDEKAEAGVVAETEHVIQQIIETTKGKTGALIRVLQQVQGVIGYLPPDVLKTVSQKLRVPLSEIYGIVSFYSFFSMVPKGEHVAQVCMGTACYVKGGERIIHAFAKDIKLEPGGITEDGKFSLETVRCLGCCGLSPVMAISGDVYRRVKPGKIKEIIGSYK